MPLLLCLVFEMKFFPIVLALILLACNRSSDKVLVHPSGVHVVDSFYLQELDRFRDLWVYLPPDYGKAEKRYPVLYMHDGQNLFEDSTSFVGEWHVDETLDSLFKGGDPGCIVVGIENDGRYRMNEYMPNVHPKYGGGGGNAYVKSIIESVKPFVDSVYRTKPEHQFTGIGGSSLGGLISFYAATMYDSIFQNALIMSPSFWIDTTYADWTMKGQPFCAFVAGKNEDDGDVKVKVDRLRPIMFALGYKASFSFPEDGEHSEWFWSREFGEAYKQLFNPENQIRRIWHEDYQEAQEDETK